MLVTFGLAFGFNQHRIPTGRLFLIVIVFYQHVVPNGKKNTNILIVATIKT
jgi:hypothetical protein